jgi:hypothetical protein
VSGGFRRERPFKIGHRLELIHQSVRRRPPTEIVFQDVLAVCDAIITTLERYGAFVYVDKKDESSADDLARNRCNPQRAHQPMQEVHSPDHKVFERQPVDALGARVADGYKKNTDLAIFPGVASATDRRTRVPGVLRPRRVWSVQGTPDVGVHGMESGDEHVDRIVPVAQIVGDGLLAGPIED